MASIARHHAEWLSLVEVSGPFLSMPVLLRVFPGGLEAHDPDLFRSLRLAYEEWEEEQDKRASNPAIHKAWIDFVLRNVLALEDVLAEGQAIAQSLTASFPEHGETLRPDIIVRNLSGDPTKDPPRLLIQTYPADQDLSKPVRGKHWKSPSLTTPSRAVKRG